MTDIIERPMTPEEKALRAEAQKARKEQELKDATDARRQGYQAISDPVFFQWQRGEKTEQDWKDAVAEVNALYPIPGEDDE
jgi:hypothetical protein